MLGAALIICSYVRGWKVRIIYISIPELSVSFCWLRVLGVDITCYCYCYFMCSITSCYWKKLYGVQGDRRMNKESCDKTGISLSFIILRRSVSRPGNCCNNCARRSAACWQRSSSRSSLVVGEFGRNSGRSSVRSPGQRSLASYSKHWWVVT